MPTPGRAVEADCARDEGLLSADGRRGAVAGCGYRLMRHGYWAAHITGGLREMVAGGSGYADDDVAE